LALAERLALGPLALAALAAQVVLRLVVKASQQFLAQVALQAQQRSRRRSPAALVALVQEEI
jgi:hypothetical protein